jgi:hypothetical protein
MLRFFSHLTPAELPQYLAQQAIDAKEIVMETQVRKVKEISTARPVGRPKKIRSLQLSTPASVSTNLANAVMPTASTSTDSAESKEKKQRIDWFASPYIHDILHAHSLMGSGYATVQYLRRKYPQLPTEPVGRFDNLAESTIDGWFEMDPLTKKKQLKTSYSIFVDQDRSTHGGGRPRWRKCVDEILDPYDPKIQEAAIQEAVKHSLEAYGFHYSKNEGQEEEEEEWNEEIMGEEDDDKDELDVMKIRIEGTRKNNRNRKQTQFTGYFINTQQVIDTDDEIELINNATKN